MRPTTPGFLDRHPAVVDPHGPEGNPLPFVSFRPVATAPAPNISLNPLQGDARPVEDWVTTFHLVVVVLDPYTYESSWIIDTASRILTTYSGADCRPAWLVAGSADDAKEFLGPWSERLLTFADPDREMIKSLELERLPALVHINQRLEVVGAAEGWNPAEWRDIAVTLAEQMSWSRPTIPESGDPTPYAGTPALASA